MKTNHRRKNPVKKNMDKIHRPVIMGASKYTRKEKFKDNFRGY